MSSNLMETEAGGETQQYAYHQPLPNLTRYPEENED